MPLFVPVVRGRFSGKKPPCRACACTLSDALRSRLSDYGLPLLLCTRQTDHATMPYPSRLHWIAFAPIETREKTFTLKALIGD